MDSYQETFETWNNIASLYEEKFMSMDLYNKTYEIFCELIVRHNARVLDVGCGPGNITKFLLSRLPNLEILGIDVSPNMLDLAQKNNTKAHFKQMDCRYLNDLQSKFDAVISGFCLPYLSGSDVQKLLADIDKLLSPGGIIYLSIVEGDPKLSGFQTSSNGQRSYFFYHDLESLKQSLDRFSIQILKEIRLEYLTSAKNIEVHTVIIGKKDSAL